MAKHASIYPSKGNKSTSLPGWINKKTVFVSSVVAAAAIWYLFSPNYNVIERGILSSSGVLHIDKSKRIAPGSIEIENNQETVLVDLDDIPLLDKIEQFRLIDEVDADIEYGRILKDFVENTDHEISDKSTVIGGTISRDVKLHIKKVPQRLRTLTLEGTHGYLDPNSSGRTRLTGSSDEADFEREFKKMEKHRPKRLDDAFLFKLSNREDAELVSRFCAQKLRTQFIGGRDFIQKEDFPTTLTAEFTRKIEYKDESGKEQVKDYHFVRVSSNGEDREPKHDTEIKGRLKD